MSENYYKEPESFTPSKESDKDSLASRVMEDLRHTRLPEQQTTNKDRAEAYLPELELVINKEKGATTLDSSIQRIFDKRNDLRNPEELEAVKALMKDLAEKLSKLPANEAQAGLDKLNEKLADAGSKTKFEIKRNEEGKTILNMYAEGERGAGTRVNFPTEKNSAEPDSLSAASKADLDKVVQAFDKREPLSTKESNDALRQIISTLNKINETGGLQAVSKAMEKLNTDLAKLESPYKITSFGKEGVAIRNGDRLVTGGLLAKTSDGLVNDTVKAAQSGKSELMQHAVQQLLDRAAAKPAEFEKLAEKLSDQLSKSGIEVKFNKRFPDRISFHQKDSDHGVEFSRTTDDFGRSRVKMQAYDWESKTNVQVKAEDVIKGFAKEKTDSSDSKTKFETSKSEFPPSVKEATDALRKGDVSGVQKAVQGVLETLKQNPEEGKKQLQQIADEAAKDGFILRANKAGTTVNVHRRFSEHGIAFGLTDDNKLTSQPYDWNTKIDTDKVSTNDVVKDFSKYEKLETVDEKNTEIVKERTALEERAAKFFTREQLQDFKENLDKFEKYAKEHKLSAQEIAKTIKATRELLEAPNTHISENDRAKLAFQVIRQAADPSSVDQGDNKTCNATTIEKVLYSQEPSRVVQTMVDIARTGGFKTPGGAEIKFDPEQLEPDNEAKNFHTKDGERSYATQITNLALINAHWQTQTRFNGKEVEKGSIRYEKIAGKGERLMDYSKEPPTPLTDKEGAEIDSPKITIGSMVTMMEAFTGKQPKELIFMRPKSEIDLDHKGMGFRGTMGSMEKSLENIAAGKNGRKFPVIVTLLDSRQLNGNSDGEGGGHVVTVTGIERDHHGKLFVRIDNQHGKDHDIKVPFENLWKAMASKEKKKEK